MMTTKGSVKGGPVGSQVRLVDQQPHLFRRSQGTGKCHHVVTQSVTHNIPSLAALNLATGLSPRVSSLPHRARRESRSVLCDYRRASASASKSGSICSKCEGFSRSFVREGGTASTPLISGATTDSNFAGCAVATMIQCRDDKLSRT